MGLFYYGSQDTPLPHRGVGRRSRTDRSQICESCQTVVPAADIRAGRATEIFGLVLCESCRMRRRADERIELYFCDHCHVSVPVFRVDTGEALAGDGRILCLDCRGRRSRSGRRRWGVALVALLISGGIFAAEVSRRGPAAPEKSIPNPGSAWIEQLDRHLESLPDPEEAEMLTVSFKDLSADLIDLGREWAAIRESLSHHNLALHRLRDDIGLRMDVLQAETESLGRDLHSLTDESPSRR